MSLLINALKKFRHESSPSLLTEGGDINTAVKTSKVKKTLLIIFAAIILVALTAMTTFFIFKQVEKTRVSKVMQGKMGKMQEMMSGRQDNATASEDAAPSAENKEDLRARLQQKMQESAVANTVTSAADQPNAGGLQAKLAERGGADFGKMKQRGGGAQGNVSSSAAETNSDSVSSENPVSDAASSDDSGIDDASVDDASVDDASVDDASVDDANSDTASFSDPSFEEASSEEAISEEAISDIESVEDASSDQHSRVSIQKVSNHIGANNPIYQQALNFTQLTQYDKAIPLLVNNDKLIIETQGLAALLLAKIYIITNQYDLADDILEHSTQLNAGSSVEVVALRAQSKFMQQQYQQVVNILAPQSPDLSSFPGYYALLAAAYMRLDQPSNAVSIFQQIVAKFPTSANYWLGLALAYQKSGDVNSALIAYRRAAQLSESNPQVLLFINQQLHTLQAI